jgi:mannose-6-phosphate isomerase-like protein (cupin superfamily)
MLFKCLLLLFVILQPIRPVIGASYYTEKQLDAFATRIGRVFWAIAVDGKRPIFQSQPASNAPSFEPSADESFEITELVARKEKNPYYKVRFESGKEAYIQPQAFLEQFNSTILTADPSAEEKKKRAAKDEEEKARLAWIETQPWSTAVKESAIRREPVIGMNGPEVKRVLGNPVRMNKVKSPHQGVEEHWFFADGTVLIFTSGMISRIDTTKKKQQP